MQTISKKTLIKNVARSWKSQYGNDKNNIYKALVESKPTTELQVEQIIGNKSWTSLRCDECQKESEIVIEIGETPDFESRTANVCIECIEKALSILKERTK